MTLTIRHATLEEIHRLYRQIPEFDSLHSLADLQLRIGSAAANALVAEIDGQPAGFKLGYQQQEKVLYSWLGGVLPAFRRHGIAQRLLVEQERWARAQGYRQTDGKNAQSVPRDADDAHRPSLSDCSTGKERRSG